MSGDDAATAIWGVLALMLVGSGLLARRLPLGKTLQMAAAWVGIFGVAFVLFLFRGEMGEVWARAKADLGGGAGQTVQGTYRIAKRDDGHFWINARVNGKAVRFMVDTGATVTSMSRETADAVGIVPSGGFPVIVQTANGMVENQRGRIGQLEVGPIVQRDAPVLIGSTLGDTNLLGMSFLGALRGWRVEGNTLILNP